MSIFRFNRSQKVDFSGSLLLITYIWFCVIPRLQKRGVKFYHRKIDSFKEVSEGFSIL